MKKLLMSLAFALPVFCFVSCGSDGGGEGEEPRPPQEGSMNDGNGPIEEPILAFYESPQYIRSAEKRKINMDEGQGDVHVLDYFGATSAVNIQYHFGEEGMYAAGTLFLKKNKERVEDFIRGKYVFIEEEDGKLQFESKDKLINVSVSTTPNTNVTSVVYLRQYTREEENGKWAAPVISNDIETVKQKEKRKLVEEDNGDFTVLLKYEDSKYLGTLTYMFSKAPGLEMLTFVGVQSIPMLHYDVVINDYIKNGYKEKEMDNGVPGADRLFVTADGKVKLYVTHLLHTEFELMFVLKP